MLHLALYITSPTAFLTTTPTVSAARQVTFTSNDLVTGLLSTAILNLSYEQGATATAPTSVTLPLSTIAFPTTGANVCTGQSSGTEGEMMTDTWGENLYVACYPLTVGTVNNFSSSFPRSIAIVSPSASVNTATKVRGMRGKRGHVARDVQVPTVPRVAHYHSRDWGGV